jgi:hypothetical protein
VSYLGDLRGQEPIDPTRVAKVFLDISELPDPSLHLVLGHSAVDRIAHEMATLSAEDARWAGTGQSVDFDDVAS